MAKIDSPSVCTTMSEPNDEVFEFDPESFCQELPEKETTQWFSEDSRVLNFLASQLAFHFKKFYRRLIIVYLKQAQAESNSELLSFNFQDFEQDSEITEILNELTENIQIYRTLKGSKTRNG